MAGAVKTFFSKVKQASNPYSLEGGKLTVHLNPFTFGRRLLPDSYDHSIKTMKRDLVRLNLPPKIQQRHIEDLLNGKHLSQDDIVLLLKSGRFSGANEETLAMALDSQEHIVKILTCFDAATANRRPIEDLRTRGKLAVKLNNQNLLAVLGYGMEIDFGNDLELVARRLEADVNIHKALELAGIKTDSRYSDGKVVNRELMKILLETALEKVLYPNELSNTDAKGVIMNQSCDIADALNGVGGIPEASDGQFAKADGNSPLFERFLKAVGNINLPSGVAILTQLGGEPRKAALMVLFPPAPHPHPDLLSAFLANDAYSEHLTADELMHIAKILIDSNQPELVECALAHMNLPDKVWLELLKATCKTDLLGALDTLARLHRAILMRFVNSETGKGRIPKESMIALESDLQEAAAYVGMLVEESQAANPQSVASVAQALELIRRHSRDETMFAMHFKRMLLEGAIENALSKRSLLGPSDHTKATVNGLVGIMASIGCSTHIYEDDARTKLTTYGRILEEVGRIMGLISPATVELWLREPGENIVK